MYRHENEHLRILYDVNTSEKERVIIKSVLFCSNQNKILDTVKLYVICYNRLIPKISFITESKKNDYSQALKYTCLQYLHKHC